MLHILINLSIVITEEKENITKIQNWRKNNHHFLCRLKRNLFLLQVTPPTRPKLLLNNFLMSPQEDCDVLIRNYIEKSLRSTAVSKICARTLILSLIQNSLFKMEYRKLFVTFSHLVMCKYVLPLSLFCLYYYVNFLFSFVYISE